jgi:H+/Na+-translocating ferredoxin:NAD+ oxidoreductase subunit B
MVYHERRTNMTTDDIYRDLQRHLDELPVGFPPTESGVEIRILKHLFTPEEAVLAKHLSLIPEPLSRIYARLEGKTGVSKHEMEATLDRMFRKGTVLMRSERGEKWCSNAMLVVGMYELQVERLTKEFARDMLQYLNEAFGQELFRSRVPQLRTIPVSKSVPHERYVSTYDDVRQIMQSVEGQIAVANCVCRQSRDVIGTGCTHTSLRETCLIFGAMAQQHLDIGSARRITKQEALEILEKAEEAGLVLQPENVQRPHYVCCCCGDCCGVLTTLKRFPRPAEFYVSNHRVTVDQERCNACEACSDRCQLSAITIADGTARVDLDRCIGCGNCAVCCSVHAIRLVKKDEETVPPLGTKALYLNIMTGKAGH